jgi:hypothetical protein
MGRSIVLVSYLRFLASADGWQPEAIVRGHREGATSLSDGGAVVGYSDHYSRVPEKNSRVMSTQFMRQF